MGDRVVAVPVIGMPAVPVVSPICVSGGPVSAQADEDVFSMIVGINISKCQARPPAIAYKKAMSRPNYPVDESAVVVAIYVFMSTSAVRFYYVAMLAVSRSGKILWTMSALMWANKSLSVWRFNLWASADNSVLAYLG